MRYIITERLDQYYIEDTHTDSQICHMYTYEYAVLVLEALNAQDMLGENVIRTVNDLEEEESY